MAKIAVEELGGHCLNYTIARSVFVKRSSNNCSAAINSEIVEKPESNSLKMIE